MKFCLASSTNIPAIGWLFKETIEAIAVSDYTPVQIAVWISDFNNAEKWQKRIDNHYFLLAHSPENTLIGFSSLDKTGYLDILYIHKDFQRQGIATQLVNRLEQKACELGLSKIYTEASLSAKLLFERKGYQTVTSQQKMYKDVAFTNFTMYKQLNTL